MPIEIPLTKGQITVISEVDADLTQIIWRAQYSRHRKIFIAVRKDNTDGVWRTLLLHRVILSRKLGRDLERNEEVDHINTNTLDNRRENLRLASGSENCYNQTKRVTNKSGHKGVSWHKYTKKWIAQIQVEKQKVYLGLFDNIEDAAEAYKQAAIKYHGEFARWD